MGGSPCNRTRQLGDRKRGLDFKIWDLLIPSDDANGSTSCHKLRTAPLTQTLTLRSDVWEARERDG